DQVTLGHDGSLLQGRTAVEVEETAAHPPRLGKGDLAEKIEPPGTPVRLDLRHPRLAGLPPLLPRHPGRVGEPAQLVDQADRSGLRAGVDATVRQLPDACRL